MTERLSLTRVKMTRLGWHANCGGPVRGRQTRTGVYVFCSTCLESVPKDDITTDRFMRRKKKKVAPVRHRVPKVALMPRPVGAPKVHRRYVEPTHLEKLPTTVMFRDGRRMLIRGLSDHQLCGWMFIVDKYHLMREKETPGISKALAREVFNRPTIIGKIRHIATKILAPPCACGKLGIYIVNTTTYCSDCKPNAIARKTKYRNLFDHHYQDQTNIWDDLDKTLRQAEKHYKAKGQRRKRR